MSLYQLWNYNQLPFWLEAMKSSRVCILAILAFSVLLGCAYSFEDEDQEVRSRIARASPLRWGKRAAPGRKFHRFKLHSLSHSISKTRRKKCFELVTWVADKTAEISSLNFDAKRFHGKLNRARAKFRWLCPALCFDEFFCCLQIMTFWDGANARPMVMIWVNPIMPEWPEKHLCDGAKERLHYAGVNATLTINFKNWWTKGRHCDGESA